MIKLQIEKYCEYCPNFVADEEKTHFVNGKTDTIIYCKNRYHCREIFEFIKREA